MLIKVMDYYYNTNKTIGSKGFFCFLSDFFISIQKKTEKEAIIFPAKQRSIILSCAAQSFHARHYPFMRRIILSYKKASL